jgi:two-component system catabolic regulation response regulator CreB
MGETPKKSVLIVEDEPVIAETILYALETEGFHGVRVGTAGEAHRALGERAFDLAILDVGLPDQSGFELCRAIRKTSAIPLFFLTARSEEVDRVVGLEMGADDYIAKPFSPRELTARIKALFRRLDGAVPKSKPGSPFRIEEEFARIRFRDESLDLTRTEFRLLRLLCRRPGRVYSRSEILDAISDNPDMSLDRTIDSHVKFLRAKLKKVDPEREWIVTHRGFGYALAEG